MPDGVTDREPVAGAQQRAAVAATRTAATARTHADTRSNPARAGPVTRTGTHAGAGSHARARTARPRRLWRAGARGAPFLTPAAARRRRVP